MRRMQQTMRWFGPNDTISLRDIRQCGVTGIVTALHQITVGDVWTVEAIKERQEIVRNAGMEWTVIESLPVHEDIKKANGQYIQYIENYSLWQNDRCLDRMQWTFLLNSTTKFPESRRVF